MKQALDAVYEKGVLRPLRSLPVAEGQTVHLVVDTGDVAGAESILDLAAAVYEGLSEEQVSEIERIALKRGPFFPPRDSSP